MWTWIKFMHHILVFRFHYEMTMSNVCIIAEEICDPPAPPPKVPTMVGFWEKSRKSDQMPYFGQNLVGFLGLK